MTATDVVWAGPDRPKVFGIGLHKTSTTSFANALYTLGYDVGGYFDTGRFADDDVLREFVLREAGSRGAVQDMPWPAFYQLLDREFPGSKFVLTMRDPQRWIASVVTHFGDRHIASHEYLYGVPSAAGHESTYLERFERHEREVREYFADRPGDLLVMDIANGDGWPELCDFLDLPRPDAPFPRQNEVGARRASRYRRIARRGIHAALRRVGVSERTLARGRVDAVTAYGSVHRMCVRFGAATALTVDDRPRLDAMLGSWLEQQLGWLVERGAPIDAVAVRAELAAGDVDSAWPVIELATRQWAADLTDEGAGVHAGDGTDASEAVRACVNTAADHLEGIARAFGLAEPVGGFDRID